ncbi:multidrug efflux transporter AcrB transmembrane domain-containing protein [Atractiella rhizophila]|nr:multidrug efflux transporter AcrB transmembrane domain-containing protein [Atractiella rhizophila]
MDGNNMASTEFQESLRRICGPAFSVPSSVCCSESQLDTLASNFATPELILGTCPGCLNNFRNFFCSFTCSPDQSLFLDAVRTQDLSEGKQGLAVKEVSFTVDPNYGTKFFDSCKNVKFGATNGYAMDVLGPGARNYKEWFRFLGKESPGLGSPFQISFPDVRPAPPDSPQQPFPPPVNSSIPLDAGALSCSAPELYARCSCLDCPEVCITLPPVPAPDDGPTCRVGKMSCFAFFLVIIYAVGLVSFLAGAAITEGWKRWRNENPATARKGRGWSSDFSSRPISDGYRYDRLPMEDPSAPGSEDNRDHSRSPVPAPQRIVPVDAPKQSNAARPPSGSSGFDSSPSPNNRARNSSDVGAVGSYYTQPKAYPINTFISSGFYHLGFWCAKRAYLTITIGLVICGLLNAGWSRFEVERNPVRLWVAKGSDSARAKSTFDEAFGPFYRTQQFIITLDSDSDHWEPVDRPVLTWDRLKWLESVERHIRDLRTESGISLNDVCFSPSTYPDAPMDSDPCVVQSILGFFGGSVETVGEEGWSEKLNDCANMPGDVDCLAPSGAPLIPKLVMGDIPRDTSTGLLKATEARALIVSFILNNSLDPDQIAKAEEWETVLRTYLEELSEYKAKDVGLAIAFSTEISLEEELNKSSNTDVPIVVLSYVVMFLYVSFSLGGTGGAILRAFYDGARSLLPSSGNDARGRNRSGSITRSVVGSLRGFSGKWLRRRLLVESKLSLGLWGIVIVLLSVSTSVAVFSLIGVKVTLIIAEVIPFLVLAIGVDNVFILVHELERQNAKAYAAIARQGMVPTAMDGDEDDDELEGLPSAEERVARSLARMGPSILLGAACETIAFSLGVLVGMPAVRNFAIYAAGAVAINTILQITVFVAVMALDLKRIEANRLDVLPFLKLPSLSPAEMLSGSGDSVLTWIMKNVFAPALLIRQVKYFVLIIFSGLFVLSWIGARHITLGLDQRLPLPRESYLIDYFNAVDTYLDVGPPVYFVVEGVDTTTRQGQQSLCGRFSTCDEFSVANVLEAERKRPESSFIVEPPAVWVDDFFQWLNPAIDTCCRIKKRNPNQFCTPRDSPFTCKPCYEDREPGWNITMEGLPVGAEFSSFIQQWITSPTDADCPLGGRASYSTSVKLTSEGEVALSHFRTYHSSLKTQDDFINAMAASQRISEDLSEQIGAHVFPYSLFYVFFDQYSYILPTTRQVLAFALLSILIVSSVLLGSWRTSAVICITVLMTVVNILGVMGVWGVSLNGISLVNLVISVGIAFEFCCHIARAFMGALGGGLPFGHPSAERDRDERAYIALIDVGPSVFSGITLTKLVGIAILSLTKSQLLQVYYVRMWLTLIISGALHGLVFLPVALSFQGSQGFSIENEDQDWMSREISSRYEAEARPLFADEESDAESIDTPY